MGRKGGLSREAVVAVALEIVDGQGNDALTLAAVAAKTKVATPSLYKHVTSLAELRTLVGVRALEEMTERLTAAVLGLSGDDAVRALMRESRAYVVEHPHRYAAMPLDALHDDAAKKAGEKLMQVFLAVFRGYGLQGAKSIHAIRCLRAMVHGFAVLESQGGFGLPENLDETYRMMIEMFVKSLIPQGVFR